MGLYLVLMFSILFLHIFIICSILSEQLQFSFIVFPLHVLYNIFCLYYMLRTSIDIMKDNSFKLAKERRRYLTQIITDADYANDIVLWANTPTQAKTMLHSLEWAAGGIGLHVNAHKMEYMCFNQRGDISTLNGSSLKLEDRFTYLGSSISSTETDINTQIAKAIDRLLIGYWSYGSQT